MKISLLAHPRTKIVYSHVNFVFCVVYLIMYMYVLKKSQKRQGIMPKTYSASIERERDDTKVMNLKREH